MAHGWYRYLLGGWWCPAQLAESAFFLAATQIGAHFTCHIIIYTNISVYILLIVMWSNLLKKKRKWRRPRTSLCLGHLLERKLYSYMSPKVVHRVAMTLSSQSTSHRSARKRRGRRDVTPRDPLRRRVAAALARSLVAAVPGEV